MNKHKPLTFIDIYCEAERFRRVRIYWNLTRKCWSITCATSKRLIGHYRGEVCLSSCAFIVSQAGRERVLRERRKNVHAFVEGLLMRPNSTRMTYAMPDGDPSQIRYNPYKAAHFMDGDGRAVHRASIVRLGSDSDHASRTISAWEAA